MLGSTSATNILSKEIREGAGTAIGLATTNKTAPKSGASIAKNLGMLRRIVGSERWTTYSQGW